MKKVLLLCALAALPVGAQETGIAIVGLVHSHVWGYLEKIAKGQTPAKLVAVSEPNPELVAEGRKAIGPDVPVYSDYKKMLDEKKPAIVWAFVENNRHLEIVQACAPRKIHVIFEKPLASTYKDALAIQALAKKHGIRVMTNYQMAWWPANYTAKAQADAGVVGKVWRLHGIVGHGGPSGPGWDSPRNKFFRVWLTDPVANGAGSLMDFGCYNALWSLWYLGKPETVYATVNHLRPELYPKVEDNADLLLHYKNGVGIFEGSWDLPAGYQDLEVFGLDGSLYMKEGSVALRKRGKSEQVALAALEPARSNPVAYMVDAVRNNKELDGPVALGINVDVVEIIEAAKQSVATGRAIKLPLGR
ncbi:MAG: Gfo/Idh/MocA family protein [Acidobacteriota bacterium]|nr:Gfo/Idh/MocA family oxidoreductase [Polyangiaceae bacterium]